MEHNLKLQATRHPSLSGKCESGKYSGCNGPNGPSYFCDEAGGYTDSDYSGVFTYGYKTACNQVDLPDCPSNWPVFSCAQRDSIDSPDVGVGKHSTEKIRPPVGSKNSSSPRPSPSQSLQSEKVIDKLKRLVEPRQNKIAIGVLALSLVLIIIIMSMK